MVLIGLVSVGLVAVITYFKLWGYLWREWITTVDHKKIGIMYLIMALLMLFRGGVDAVMMRYQLSMPDNTFLDAQHYNEVFTTHGVVMLLFMAMPFITFFFNYLVPLQIGARDVAFPRLNNLSFWLFFMGAMLFNLSFVVGGSPDAGWTSYFPLADVEFSTSVGTNYYMIALQIAGLGTLITGINFITTIMKMRAPGMTLFKMPMFTWSALIANLIVVFAFPLWNLTIPAKLQTFIDYVYAAGFAFKYDAQGNMVQLMTDKKAIFLNARGGIYSTPEAAPMEMAVNYMRAVFGGVFGMQIIDEVIIEGHNAMPAKAQEIISAGMEEVKASAQRLVELTVKG